MGRTSCSTWWVPSPLWAYRDVCAECVWQRTDSYFPAIENLPDVRGYATHDLFVPHPTKPGLWKVYVPPCGSLHTIRASNIKLCGIVGLEGKTTSSS